MASSSRWNCFGWIESHLLEERLPPAMGRGEDAITVFVRTMTSIMSDDGSMCVCVCANAKTTTTVEIVTPPCTSSCNFADVNILLLIVKDMESSEQLSFQQEAKDQFGMSLMVEGIQEKMLNKDRG